eukprot:2602635-Lingulodinium_polyedra.AAC.1
METRLPFPAPTGFEAFASNAGALHGFTNGQPFGDLGGPGAVEWEGDSIEQPRGPLPTAQ